MNVQHLFNLNIDTNRKKKKWVGLKFNPSKIVDNKIALIILTRKKNRSQIHKSNSQIAYSLKFYQTDF